MSLIDTCECMFLWGIGLDSYHRNLLIKHGYFPKRLWYQKILEIFIRNRPFVIECVIDRLPRDSVMMKTLTAEIITQFNSNANSIDWLLRDIQNGSASRRKREWILNRKRRMKIILYDHTGKKYSGRNTAMSDV